MSVKPSCFRWAVDLSNFTPTIAQLTTACWCIQPEERVRLMKFHFIDDFLSSLVGRLLMRKFVSETTSIPYSEINFDRDVRGKPYLKNSHPDSQRISFNVSHHAGMVVLAGVVVDQQQPSSDFGVGIDVMKVEYTGGKPLSDFFRLMSKTFSDVEWRYINRTHHTESDKLKAFVRHWCLKESYVKNIGVGITVDLQKISFTIRTDELTKDKSTTSATLRVNDVPARECSFEEHMLDAEHCVAIAFKNCTPEDIGVFSFFKFDELLVEKRSTATEEMDVYCHSVLEKERKKLRS